MDLKSLGSLNADVGSQSQIHPSKSLIWDIAWVWILFTAPKRFKF